MRRAIALLLAGTLPGAAFPASSSFGRGGFEGGNGDTSTPIKHLVVIFQENISFDHYFGTYPRLPIRWASPFSCSARNAHRKWLHARLTWKQPERLNPANGDGAANPFRLSERKPRPPTRITITAGAASIRQRTDGPVSDSVGTAGPPPSAPPVK